MNVLTDELSQNKSSIWPKLNLLFAAMIAVVIGVTVLYQAIPVSEERRAQEQLLAKLEEKIVAAEITNRRRTREVELLQKDPEYIGIIARDRMNLMKDGETILRMEGKN